MRKAIALSDSRDAQPAPPRLSEEQAGIQLGQGSPPRQLAALIAADSPVHSIEIPKDIQELAEEIVCSVEEPGLEPSTLVLLLQVTLFLERQRARLASADEKRYAYQRRE